MLVGITTYSFRLDGSYNNFLKKIRKHKHHVPMKPIIGDNINDIEDYTQ